MHTAFWRSAYSVLPAIIAAAACAVFFITLPVKAEALVNLVATQEDTAESDIFLGNSFSWRMYITNTGDTDALIPAGTVLLQNELSSDSTHTSPGVSPGSLGVDSITCNITPDAGGDILTCTANSAFTIPANGMGTTSVRVEATPLVEGTVHSPRLPDGECTVDPGLAIAESDENNACSADSVDVFAPPTETARLTLITNVTNNNSGIAGTNEWFMRGSGPSSVSTVGGLSGSLAVTNAIVAPGDYELSANGFTAASRFGYFAPTTWTCNGGAPSSRITINTDDDITCTLVFDDIPPITISGDSSGTVQEDGATTTTGTLTTDSSRIVWTINGGSNANPTANQVDFFVDRATVGLANAPVFENDFNVAPPAGGTWPITAYGEWTASDGKATVAPNGAVQSYRNDDAAPRLATAAIFNTDINQPGSLNRGTNFVTVARFDLVIPDELDEGYGIFLTTANPPYVGQRVARLGVVKSASDGIVRVAFRQENHETGAVFPRGSAELTPSPSDDQIRLRIFHPPGTNSFTAQYELMDDGVVTSTTTIPGNPAILFDASNFIRAGIWGSTPGELDSVMEGTYGTLTIHQTNGTWNYQLGATPAQQGAIAGLASQQVVNDNFTVHAKRYLDGPSDEQVVSIQVTAAEKPVITPQTSTSTSGSVTINWTTDEPATSRVIYDTASHSTLGAPPNYGYASSTIEDPTLVTNHSVTVTGLNPSTTYYFRSVSHGSPESVGEEVIATTEEEGSEPVTLSATADSFLRRLNPDRNEGANPRMRIQALGDNRAVVQFDEAAIDNFVAGNFTKATLVLTIADSPDNWGLLGNRTVDAHALTTPFAEGNGKEMGVPNSQATRGTGAGTTWKCASDSNTANTQTNCSPHWDGGSFSAATAPSQVLVNGQVGEVSWDVTQDVLNGASGWLIKKTSELLLGNVEYYAREGAAAAGNPTFAPRLVLE